ncbi:MAG: DUF4139 domain-containing protein [Deltaproteobacteria bacterium]|nr:DUF4139 domain-containing protein [Deltaproteobacteria bacterium]
MQHVPLSLAALVALFSSSMLSVPGTTDAAEEVRVTLEDQKAVAVTIYNEDLALIRDRRRVMLQRGENRVAFVDVSAQMTPETALLHGERADLAIVEQNFDFDLLTPQKLLEKSIGEKVRLVRTNPESGEDTFEDATVLSVAEGVVLQVGDRIETATPGRIVFNQVPANLRSRPTLVLQLDSGAAGDQAVELSYLTGGLGWKADYVAELATDEKTLDLAGWVTLTNTSGSTYRDAKLRLVAGNVNVVRPKLMQRDAMPMMAMESAGAASRMREQALFEYHLYDLERPTTVAENQTKQVALLSGSRIPVSKEYRFTNISSAYDERIGELPRTNASVRLSFDNEEEDQLGVPLPKGTVRVYKADSQGQMLFVGEDAIEHTPKNEKVELTLGQAFDVTARSKQTDYQHIGDNVIEVAFEVEIRNAKKEPISVAVLEQLPAQWKVLEESHPHEKPQAFQARWTVPVLAENKTILSYRVRITY